ncbi:MAG: hypothetical protein D6713_06445 [Deltaproteobacteria bacterium]|nr:MAG: hypothetical protein D6713_06445 [Deltaproteobacteria bacterium]
MRGKNYLVAPVVLGIVLFFLAILGTSSARASHPAGDVTLRDLNGDPISIGSTTPYSPKQTCATSGCHDYGTITSGFHFNQGKDEIAENPPRDASKPWVLSPGMYGKW